MKDNKSIIIRNKYFRFRITLWLKNYKVSKGILSKTIIQINRFENGYFTIYLKFYRLSLNITDIKTNKINKRYHKTILKTNY